MFRFQKSVTRSLTFYKEEIDEELIPPFVLEHHEEPIQTESANYTDAKGDYYLVIQVETGDIEPYEVWMLNDEVIPNFTKKQSVNIGLELKCMVNTTTNILQGK